MTVNSFDADIDKSSFDVDKSNWVLGEDVDNMVRYVRDSTVVDR